MNDMVATKAQDTPTFVTSSQARRNDRDQGCRISSGPAVLCRTKGRTYDRSRPKRSDRRKPACQEAVQVGATFSRLKAQNRRRFATGCARIATSFAAKACQFES